MAFIPYSMALLIHISWNKPCVAYCIYFHQIIQLNTMMFRLILRPIRVTPKHDYIDRVTFTNSKNMTGIFMHAIDS